MDELDELMAAAEAELGRITAVVNELGFTYVSVRNPFGLGVGIAFSESEFVVMSVMGGAGSSLNIASGVLADISAERLAILEACNRRTQDNPAYPVYLHDAEAGWDILLATMMPIQLAVDSPGYLATLIRGFPGLANDVRAEFLAGGIEGRGYAWGDDDLYRLVLRSML